MEQISSFKHEENGNVILELCVDRSTFKEGSLYLFFLFVLKKNIQILNLITSSLFVCIIALIWKISGLRIIFLKYKEWNVIVERCITGQYLKRTDV